MNQNLDEVLGAPVPNWTPPPFPEPKVMQGRYCKLEPLGVQHAQSLFEANNTDPEGKNWTYLPYGPFDSLQEYSDWIEQVAKGLDPQFYAVIQAETNRAIGIASYLRITPAAGSIEVGHIHFSPLLQRTPAATETMYLMMRNAYELGYRRYEWKCNALNRPSRDAALRLGLSYEGVFRQAAVVKSRNRDTAWYAGIDSEWPELKAAFERWLNLDNFDEGGGQRVSLSGLTGSILINIG